MYLKTYKHLSSLIALLLLSYIDVRAQHRGNDSSQLEDIIVSASRMPESVKQSAVTVTIISKQQIEQISQINPDVTAILGYLVPGMGMPSNTTSNRSQTLRGRTPLLLIDGVPQSTPLRLSDRDLRSIDAGVIDHIEIIKAATSIYGNGASGGIINIITKPTLSDGQMHGTSSIAYMSHGIGDNMFTRDGGAGYRVSQQLSGKIGKLDYLASGMLRQTGVAIDGNGQIISPRYGLGETKTWNAFLKLGYQLTAKSRLTGMYNFYNSLQNTKYIPQNGKYLTSPAIGVIGQHQGVKEGTRYNHNAYINYNNSDIFKNTSLDITAYYQNLYTIYDYRTAPRWYTGGQSTVKGKKYGLRANLNSRIHFADWWNSSLTYGVDGLIDKTAQPLVDGRLWVPWLTGTNIAPFLQTHNTFFNNLVFKAGVRYDYLQVKVPDYNTVPNTNKPINVDGGKLNYRRVTFNMGIAYTKIKEFQPYVSFSQGMSIYDLGRILRSADENTVSELNTTPVLTNNYEFGFNSSIGQKLELSGSIFQSKAKLGADLVSVDGFWVPERAPQKIWGWELNANYAVLKNLKLGGSYSWQEGKSDAENTGKYDNYLSGLLIAPSKLDIHAQYFPISKLNIALYYIHTGNRNRFQSIKDVYNEGEGPVKPIDLFNLNAGYKINAKWDVNLGIENLFNKTYYTQISMINARDAEYARGNGCYYTLTFRYHF